MKMCDVTQATHVESIQRKGDIQKIVSKWGIDEHGHLAKPSEGGFGCITERGDRVDMWQANAYYQDV